MSLPHPLPITPLRPNRPPSLAVYLTLEGKTRDLVDPRVGDHIEEALRLLINELAPFGLRVAFQSGTSALLHRAMPANDASSLLKVVDHTCDELRELMSLTLERRGLHVVLRTRLGPADEVLRLQD